MEAVETKLRERDAKLVRVIESLDILIGSKEWSSLKEEVFDGLVESLERQMKVEGMKPEVNVPTLYRLQGELRWANRYSNLEHLRAMYHQELVNIRKQVSPVS